MWYYCASRTGRCCAHSKVHATAFGFVFRSCHLLYCASCRPPLPLYLMSWQLLYSKQGICHYCASRSGSAVFQTMCLPPFCFKSWQLLYSKPEVCHHCASRSGRCCTPNLMFATIVFQDLAVVLQTRCLPQLCFKIWQSLCSRPPVCHHCASRSGSCCTQTRCLRLLCFKIWQLLCSKADVCHYCASRSGNCCTLNQVFATIVLQDLAAAVLPTRNMPLLCFKSWQPHCL